MAKGQIYAGTKVYITQNKKGKFVVMDCSTNKLWANEFFKDEAEAIQFCKDNGFIIVERKIFETRLKAEEVKKEDDGQAMIFTVSDPFEEENGMFVRIQSWDEKKEHKELNKFIGKKVIITIETID